MTYQAINLGTTTGDGTGDAIRQGGDKINDNFVELYTLFGTGTELSSGISATATVITLTSPVISGVLALPDGTNLAPSFTNAGDINTGIYFSAADTVSVTTGGTKRVDVDSLGLNVTGAITASTTIQGTTITATTAFVGGSVTTEHGAGAIATSFAPITRRFTQNGVIITKIHFDLTALGAKGGTANDVIGLPAGGSAFIGRNVVSLNGIVFKAELACIELPAVASGTVTTDIDIATNPSGIIAFDAAGGTTKLFNTGGMVAGQELSNITPTITANDYFYLVEADTTASDAVFNAGQCVLTLYGHAIS